MTRTRQPAVRIAAGAAATLAAMAAGPAIAQPTYRLLAGPEVFIEQANYFRPTGEVISFSVYLEESVPPGEGSQLLAGNGLFSADFVLTRLPQTLLEPATITSYSLNAAEFNDPFGPIVEEAGDLSRISAIQFVDIFAASGPVGVQVAAGIRRVRLASFSVQLGTVIGETTEFELASEVGDSTVLLDLPIALDPGIEPVTLRIGTPCDQADYAEPFGQLDVFDILVFFDLFIAAAPSADVSGDGRLDVFDVLLYFDAFIDACV